MTESNTLIKHPVDLNKKRELLPRINVDNLIFGKLTVSGVS